VLFQLGGVLFVWLLAPTVMCFVSFAYWRSSGASNSFADRLLPASHGAVGTLVFLSAFIVVFTRTAAPHFREPYLAMWLVPLAFIGVSLWRFKGPPRVHLLLLPLVAAMGWAVVVGYTIIGGGK
jgi:hypothetical protein